MNKVTKISSPIDKAIYEYDLIEDGDKILIGASGGKDSTALIEYFAQRSKRPNCNFEYKALYIQSDFSPAFPEGIMELFKKWEVPFETVDVDIIGRLKPGFKMNCWWCSTQRRSELLKYAMEHGYNKIALGHHMDDFLETLLMNMLNKGELASMTPKLKYDNYPITVIRPLCYVLEEKIIEHAENSSYSKFTCTCSYQDNSKRKEARKLLENLTGGEKLKKELMFNSLKNIKLDYLPKGKNKRN